MRTDLITVYDEINDDREYQLGLPLFKRHKYWEATMRKLFELSGSGAQERFDASPKKFFKQLEKQYDCKITLNVVDGKQIAKVEMTEHNLLLFLLKYPVT